MWLSNFLDALSRKKSSYSEDAYDDGSGSREKLARVLGLTDLTLLGIGATLGVGVYVLAGSVAKNQAGPSVVISFIIAALASALSGLCYVEFASRISKSGSAYNYTYLSIGEFAAYIIGWNLVLEYIIGTASEAKAISNQIDSLLGNAYQKSMESLLPIRYSFLSTYPDFIAAGIVMLMSALISWGVSESTRLNSVFTFLNLGTVVVIVGSGLFKMNPRNWAIRKEDIPRTVRHGGTGGFAPFGLNGIIVGAAKCFFGFVGFDCIATTGEESKNPKRDIPLSILLSLFIVFVCYLAIAIVLTLIIPYYEQDAEAPFPHIFDSLGWPVMKWLVTVGSLFALLTAMFGALFPLPRILYAMSLDGLLYDCFSYVSPRTKTPVLSSLLTGALTAVLSAVFKLDQLVDMLSIGTLLAYTIVALSVLILRYSEDGADTPIKGTSCAEKETKSSSFAEKDINAKNFSVNALPEETLDPSVTYKETLDRSVTYEDIRPVGDEKSRRPKRMKSEQSGITLVKVYALQTEFLPCERDRELPRQKVGADNGEFNHENGGFKPENGRFNHENGGLNPENVGFNHEKVGLDNFPLGEKSAKSDEVNRVQLGAAQCVQIQRQTEENGREFSNRQQVSVSQPLSVTQTENGASVECEKQSSLLSESMRESNETLPADGSCEYNRVDNQVRTSYEAFPTRPEATKNPEALSVDGSDHARTYTTPVRSAAPVEINVRQTIATDLIVSANCTARVINESVCVRPEGKRNGAVSNIVVSETIQIGPLRSTLPGASSNTLCSDQFRTDACEHGNAWTRALAVLFNWNPAHAQVTATSQRIAKSCISLFVALTIAVCLMLNAVSSIDLSAEFVERNATVARSSGLSRNYLLSGRGEHDGYIDASTSEVKPFHANTLGTVIGMYFTDSQSALTGGPVPTSDCTSALQYATFTLLGLVYTVVFVCLARQNQNRARLKFKVPWVPLVPCLSIFMNIYLMINLDISTWVRFVIWLVIGFGIYFTYGISHSKQKLTKLA
ncbi:cationic amino acid transporter 3-like isoform X1 [Diaphorina citri]|uniref:Cationic amino acid transporter 3-like isoform X1 n=2 Tax=Diaphorina citri TaxID=121845 RepID=A0A1S3D136_DIACI|nr:cationic amino acid transporter 3-like isoform X2 [Diaphorina citri]XP_026679403.1 cationic amino acid transporter 3-like isoform X1 [Diaphorina citri]KAI5708435.1 hypothetical protein M8J77_022536 [Diaphorina citri]